MDSLMKVEQECEYSLLLLLASSSCVLLSFIQKSSAFLWNNKKKTHFLASKVSLKFPLGLNPFCQHQSPTNSTQHARYVWKN